MISPDAAGGCGGGDGGGGGGGGDGDVETEVTLVVVFAPAIETPGEMNTLVMARIKSRGLFPVGDNPSANTVYNRRNPIRKIYKELGSEEPICVDGEYP